MRMFLMSVVALFTCVSVGAANPIMSDVPKGHKLTTTFEINVFKAPDTVAAKYDDLKEGTKLPGPEGFFCEIQGSHMPGAGTAMMAGVRCIIASAGSAGILGAMAEVSCKIGERDADMSTFALFGSKEKTLYIYRVTCVTR